MLSTDERKVILCAVRTETIITISQNTEESLKKISDSDILMRDMIVEIWENTQRCLRSQNAMELLEREKLSNFDYMPRIRTILGNMHVADRKSVV